MQLTTHCVRPDAFCRRTFTAPGAAARRVATRPSRRAGRWTGALPGGLRAPGGQGAGERARQAAVIPGPREPQRQHRAAHSSPAGLRPTRRGSGPGVVAARGGGWGDAGSCKGPARRAATRGQVGQVHDGVHGGSGFSALRPVWDCGNSRGSMVGARPQIPRHQVSPPAAQQHLCCPPPPRRVSFR